MNLSELNSRVGQFTAPAGRTGQRVSTTVPGLWIYESLNPTPISAALFHPVVSLTLQGEKETHLGDRTEFFRPGDSLIVSHELPVQSRITVASPT
ncbi:MAG: AraC family transcriptional regulator, partial [Myxococcota bacterium]